MKYSCICSWDNFCCLQVVIILSLLSSLTIASIMCSKLFKPKSKWFPYLEILGSQYNVVLKYGQSKEREEGKDHGGSHERKFKRVDLTVYHHIMLLEFLIFSHTNVILVFEKKQRIIGSRVVKKEGCKSYLTCFRSTSSWTIWIAWV